MSIVSCFVYFKQRRGPPLQLSIGQERYAVLGYTCHVNRYYSHRQQQRDRDSINHVLLLQVCPVLIPFKSIVVLVQR